MCFIETKIKINFRIDKTWIEIHNNGVDDAIILIIMASEISKNGLMQKD